MHFFLRSLLAFACTSCLFDDGRERSPIVPLAVGNTWTYVDSAYYGEDSVATGSARMVITGRKTVTLEGKEQTVYLARDVNPATGDSGAQVTYLQDRPDGNYTLGAAREGAEFLLAVLHLEYPATEGRRYPTVFISFGREGSVLVPVLDTVEIEVVDARRTCRVPAGAFDCVQYRGWRGDVVHATGYYAPGTGFLGYESERIVEVNGVPRTVTFVRRLSDYDVRDED